MNVIDSKFYSLCVCVCFNVRDQQIGIVENGFMKKMKRDLNEKMKWT